jgi:hypothetical protein
MIVILGVQTVILTSTAGGVALIGLWFDRLSLVWLINELKETPFPLTFIALIILVIGLFISLTLFPKVRTWFSQHLAYFYPSRVGMAALIYGIIFVGYGIMISWLLKAFWEIDMLLQWYHFTWGFTLAWVLGFVVPGAPGGLGIREVILFGLYRQELGTGIVIGLSLLLRIITSLGDLLTFGIAFCLDHFESDTPLFRRP